MGLKGVKKRPTEVNGDKLTQTVYAITKNKFFGIVMFKQGHNQHTTFGIIKLNKGGKIAKRQIKELSDRDYNSQGDAKHAVRVWDLA